MRLYANLGVLELSPREHDLLELIARRPGITPTEAARELGVSRSRVAQLLHALEQPRVRRES